MRYSLYFGIIDHAIASTDSCRAQRMNPVWAAHTHSYVTPITKVVLRGPMVQAKRLPALSIQNEDFRI